MNLLIPVSSPVSGTWGGLTRALAIAHVAREAGHRVAFCASGYLESRLRERGFHVFPMPQATLFGLPAAFGRGFSKRQHEVAPPIRRGHDFGDLWFVFVLSGMARAGYLDRLLDAERRAASTYRADFIFTDLDPGAFLLAQLESLPIAAAFQSPLLQGTGSMTWRLMNHAVGAVLRRHHLPAWPIQELFYGPQVLKIIPSIPELESTDPSRRDVRYVGRLLEPIQPGGSFLPLQGKRYVFVYLGTGAVPLRTALQVLPQVFPAEGKLRCLMAAQSLERTETIGGVELHPFVPAADVLPCCNWTICHGGQNTIIESLENGVPLLIFPGPIFERRYNARKVRDAGAGVMAELPDFKAGFITRVLGAKAAYAARANQLGEMIRASDGARAAMSAMEMWRCQQDEMSRAIEQPAKRE